MQQKNAKICVIQLNENNGNGNASVVFCSTFHLVWRCFFQQRSCAEMQCRCLCSFHQFSMFCLHSNFSLCNFCLLVVPLHLRFCFFRKNFQYAVARCVGYFTTTFCAEMQCRCFFAVLINFQCFLRSNLSPCILSVGCAVAPRFCFLRKNFQYAVARCVGYFSTTFCAEMQCRCLCRFHQLSMFCLCSNLSPCNFCLLVVQLFMRFCFSQKFCVFVCKLSGRLSEIAPRQGSLLVSTVCLA